MLKVSDTELNNDINSALHQAGYKIDSQTKQGKKTVITVVRTSCSSSTKDSDTGDINAANVNLDGEITVTGNGVTSSTHHE
jgi:hypothetical protein